jgi:ATP-dependent protease HslVU (ClpYQ) ATPase subunit
MYKEGRQFVVDAKKEIDGVVKDVKQAQNDVKGIWAFFTSLFSSDKRVEAVQEQPKKKVKQKAPEFDENKIYADVADALTKFFHAYNGLKAYMEEQEALATTVGNEEGQDIAIKLVIANLQMEKLNEELREYMVYHVPAEMKDLYSRVNKMIGHIANQQQLARKEELDKQKRLAWQRKQVTDRIQQRIMVGMATAMVILWVWISIIAMIPFSSS